MALYRIHRPLLFSDIAGQEHITNTLRRQIENSAISHAYLFTGTRGTGKTTCARVFSRAINCLSPKNGEPCNECKICKGLLDSGIYDVCEIDAASNNGVDNIRQLRDEILFSPMSAKFKVYIIDEVHMLSSGAFNALLKTLEEPPAHAVFLLATTEPHKVPATILSRCQRFDFFRLNIETITLYLDKILSKEGKIIDKSSVRLVAELADGSMRDALSILEKVLEMNSPEKIEHILGVIGKKSLYQAAESIARGDTDSLYSLIGELFMASKDMTVFINELTELFRKLTVARTSENCEKLIDASEDDIKQIKSISNLFSEKFLIYAMQKLRETRQILTRSHDLRAEVELCLLLLAKPEYSEDFASLAARVEKLEQKTMIINERSFIKSTQKTETSQPKEISQATKNILEPEIKKQNSIGQNSSKEQLQADEKPEKEVKSPISEEISENKSKASEKEEPQALLQNEPELPQTQEIKAEENGEWRIFESLNFVAGRVLDIELRIILTEYSQAVYKGNEIVIITSNASDVDVLRKKIDKLKAAFEADKKFGRTITIERGENAKKYLDEATKRKNDISAELSVQGYSDLENNAMFKID